MNRIENITIAQCLDQGVQNDVHLIENATVVWQEDILYGLEKQKRCQSSMSIAILSFKMEVF